jgi:hypothetical protein
VPEGELNLADEEPLPPAGPARTTTRAYVYDPEPERERVRGRLAIGLFLLVAVLSAAAFALTASNRLSTSDLDKLQPLLAALITLTGTALGFYFGGRSR